MIELKEKRKKECPMKKNFKNCLTALSTMFGLLLSASPVPAETKAAEAYTVKVETGYLALRSEASYDASNELEELYTGDTFYVMSDYDSTYVYGYSESGKEGYVNKNYLVSAYNIASGIKTRASEGSSYLETDYFSLYLPGDISWEYKTVDNTAISIYYTPAKEAGYGGHVVTIRAYDWMDNEYADFPSWSMAGLSNEKKFVAVFPTDVQFNLDDAVQSEEYGRLLQVAKRMDCEDEQLAKDNPFDVKE